MPTFTLNGQPLAYGPFVTGEGDEAITHTAEVLALWSDADLETLGVERIPDPPRVAPPPPRPELPKSAVVLRLAALGGSYAADAMTALKADPVKDALWFSPDWPNVYKDDADLLQLLEGAGLTAEQIAQVTA